MDRTAKNTEFIDYRSDLPYPKAVHSGSHDVIILNLYERFEQAAVKNIFAATINHTSPGSVTPEKTNRSRRFWAGINAGLTIVGNITEFERVRLIDLPDDFYRVSKEATRASWGRLKVWDMPADEAIGAFELTQSDTKNSEIIVIPPHKNLLEPYATATENLLNKTPHFLQYTEIYYGGDSPWSLSEYRPELRNYMGEVSGAL